MVKRWQVYNGALMQPQHNMGFAIFMNEIQRPVCRNSLRWAKINDQCIAVAIFGG